MPHLVLSRLLSSTLRLSPSQVKAVLAFLLLCSIPIKEHTLAGNRSITLEFTQKAISSGISISDLSMLLPLTTYQHDDKRTKAMTDVVEADRLYREKTPESLQAAITKLQEASLLFHELKDSSGEALCFSGLGEIYEFKLDWENALGYNQKALGLFRAINNPIGEHLKRETLNKIGRIYANGLGEMYKALEAFQEACSLFHAVQDRKSEAMTLKNIGTIYLGLGVTERALEKFQEARLKFRELSVHSDEVLMLVFISFTQSQSGATGKALKALEEALAILRATAKESPDEAVILLLAASVYIDLREQQKALEKYQEALAIFLKAKNIPGEVVTLNNIGLTLFNRGDKQKALEEFQKALKALSIPAMGEWGYKTTVLGNLGYVYSGLGERQKALEYYQRALLMFQIIEDSEGEPNIYAWRNQAAMTLSNLMMLENEIGNRRLAILYGKKAINNYQQIRARLRSFDEEQQKAFVRPKEEIYRKLAELLIRENRLSEAHRVLNLFKDQEYFDFTSQSQLALKPDARMPLTNVESNTEQRFQQAAREAAKIQTGKRSRGLQSADRQPPLIEEKQPKQLEAKDVVDRVAQYNEYLRNLQSESDAAIDHYLDSIRSIEKDYLKTSSAADKLERLSDTEELQSVLRQLNQETGQKAAAVYTLVGVDHFRALIVTNNGLTSVSTVMEGTELNEKARQLWGLLQSADYDPSALSSELYNIIFKPIEDKLPKDTKTILWSLDGNLRYLPMAALYDGKQYLVERFSHVVFTRADKGRLTHAVSATWKGYGFATSASHKVEVGDKAIEFSPLDFVKDEMQIFRTKSYPDGIIDGEVFLDAQFNKASLLATLKQKRPLVHISSHFKFRPGDKSNSFLLLGDGTMMTLAEMKEQADLFQGVELLTLSACDTAAQRSDATGREIDAFAELAQRLGAGGVMASLWAVRDRTTAQLMKGFYKNRESGKNTKAEALRKSQLNLLYGNLQSPATTINHSNETVQRDSPTDENIIVEKKYRIPFRPDKKKPFAHPYYWSPFVLFGNWK
jgi:CHAT domain-containing protein